MNIHKNARLTFARRLEMVRQMSEQGVSPGRAANLHAVSVADCAQVAGPLPGPRRSRVAGSLLAPRPQSTNNLLTLHS